MGARPTQWFHHRHPPQRFPADVEDQAVPVGGDDVVGPLRQAPPAGKKQLAAGFEDAFKGRALPPLPDELLAALVETGAGSAEFRARRGDPAAVAEALVVIGDAKRKPEERAGLIRARWSKPD